MNSKMARRSPCLFWFVSAETVAKTGMILLAGEITSSAMVDYQKVVRDTIRQIGYDDSSKGAYYLGAFTRMSIHFSLHGLPVRGW